jgi:hypothetical protein
MLEALALQQQPWRRRPGERQQAQQPETISMARLEPAWQLLPAARLPMPDSERLWLAQMKRLMGRRLMG